MMPLPQLVTRSALCVALLAVPATTAYTEANRDGLYRNALALAAERAQADLLANQTGLWEDHSSWDDPWRVRSEHYEVVTTASRLKGVELAQGLETMLGHFQELLGTTFVPPNVVQVLVHPTVDEYNAFGDNNGEEHSSFYPSFVPENHPDQPVATLESPNGTRQLRWVTHGALHRYLLDAEVELPAWLDEGLASYFALYWAFPSAVAELQALRDSDGWVSVDDLITDEISAFLDRPEARQLELGMLFSYLMNYREGTRIERDEQGNVIASPFLDYIRLRTRNRDSAQHPVAKLLGSATSRAELDREFRAFDGW